MRRREERNTGSAGNQERNVVLRDPLLSSRGQMNGARNRRRGREDEEVTGAPTAAFAVPIGSRDLSQLFSEIFETQTQIERQMRRVREPRAPTASLPMSQPPPSWFLKPGQIFTGWQHVTHWPPCKPEKWSVNVTIDSCNFATGEVLGSMVAYDVPGSAGVVTTYFEGEIIDNVNHTFYSDPDASDRACVTEIRHWLRFPVFRPMRSSIVVEDGRTPALVSSQKVFMRWKEKFFITGGDCRLTIEGLYYVTLDRKTGDIDAYYFDPNSAPEQKLLLKAGASGSHGYSLPQAKFA